MCPSKRRMGGCGHVAQGSEPEFSGRSDRPVTAIHFIFSQGWRGADGGSFAVQGPQSPVAGAISHLEMPELSSKDGHVAVTRLV